VPQPDEHPIVVSIVPHPCEIVEEIVKRLRNGSTLAPPDVVPRRWEAAATFLQAETPDPPNAFVVCCVFLANGLEASETP
jgi:hypothetical protein